MKVLIALKSVIPATKYGGIERAIWYLGKELAGMGHEVTFLVNEGSECSFAKVIYFQKGKNLNDLIPEDIEIVQLEYNPEEGIKKPYVVNCQVNVDESVELDENTIFVSRDHASRYGSNCYVYNGMDWNDYGLPDFRYQRKYFHFLGKAAWRVKNIKGAIRVAQKAKQRLKVLGGTRLNFKMGFRLTLDPRIEFYGMVGGDEKNGLLRNSKGLIFPVRWHEPFGIAITESLYFGCPVFGTPYGSLPELVTSEFGHLSTDSNELAESILNADSYSKKKCHEYARDKFNSRVMAEAYIKKYEQVLNGASLNEKKPKLVHPQKVRFLPWAD
ncbi:MAG: glycosyltransferase [Cyclobacteriaceae bacterium]